MKADGVPASGEIQLTRYPLVLVHGAFRGVAFLRSFGKIDEELTKLGYTVYLAETDAFGPIEENAERLKNQISKLLEDKNVEKVNIIAHSKGGLDARHLIESLGGDRYVASLTTLCTPHGGSPVASAILQLPRWMLKIIAFWFNLVNRIAGDEKPDSLTVCEQLKRHADGKTNADPIPGVYCQSFSSTMKKGERKNDFVMRIPAAFCRVCEKDMETDGLVPKDSTVYGEYRGDAIDGSVSHSEMIDLLTRKEKRKRVYAFYADLCSDLAKKGF